MYILVKQKEQWVVYCKMILRQFHIDLYPCKFPTAKMYILFDRRVRDMGWDGGREGEMVGEKGR